MAEVHQAPSRGKGSAPSLARQRVHELCDAAYNLVDAWDDGLNRRTYPRYLPSFDEFFADLRVWRDDLDEIAEAEDSDLEALDLRDPKAILDWIRNLEAAVEDAIAAGEDATRPLRKRVLGAVTARTHIREARLSFRELVVAAQRGAARLSRAKG
jgi:hypothetical protein